MDSSVNRIPFQRDEKLMHDLRIQAGVDVADTHCEALAELGMPMPQDPLPDYTQSNGSYILEEKWFDIPATSMSRKAHFYEGALAVLRLLSTPETMSQEDMVKLARKLTHEARHEIRKMAKESTNF